MFLHVFVHPRGGSAFPPPGQYPQGLYPSRAVPPPPQPPDHTTKKNGPKRTVRILPECILIEICIMFALAG